MFEDLSRYHAPITKLFPAPATSEEWEQYRLTDEQRRQFKPVAVELKAGEASFYHPRMIHGSYANSTPRPRRATVINVFRDGVRSNSDSPLLEGVPAIPKGLPMSGRFFPLLFDPDV